MKIIILGGFLGAGKTSVLLQLAKHVVAQAPEKANRIAIIENEIGDIGVDDKTLGGSGGYDVRTLFSGCVCCSLSVELIDGLRRLRDELDPDYVVIEPSGVADPSDLAEKIGRYVDAPIAIVTLVDAERWRRIRRAMVQILPGQLEHADVILINKVDRVDPEVADEVEAQVREYNTTARIDRIVATEQIPDDVLDAIAGE